MGDLTERLAAKLWPADLFQYERLAVAEEAPRILPLLLSEPELVASLPEEVRAKALESLLNSAPVMESAFVDAAEVLALAPEELRRSVLTPRERAVMKLGEQGVRVAVAEKAVVNEWSHDEAKEAAIQRSLYRTALAEVKALTPEGKDA